jgi:hypothetical protein
MIHRLTLPSCKENTTQPPRVRIFPKAAVQVKKATLSGTLTLQMLFQGKEWTIPERGLYTEN